MMEEKPDYEIVGWEKLQGLTKILARKIKESRYEPDIIVGISKGGWTIARIICDHIDGKDIISLDAKHWELHKQASSSPLSKTLFGKRVLMVYDIMDEESMHGAIKYLVSLKPDGIKTLALFYVKGEMKPDYYAGEINNKLVIFPWNLADSIRKLIYSNPDEFGEMNAKGIRSRLKQGFNIDLEEKVIEEILKDRERFKTKQK